MLTFLFKTRQFSLPHPVLWCNVSTEVTIAVFYIFICSFHFFIVAQFCHPFIKYSTVF